MSADVVMSSVRMSEPPSMATVPWKPLQSFFSVMRPSSSFVNVPEPNTGSSRSWSG